MSPPTSPMAVVSWPSRSVCAGSISTRRVTLYWALGVTAKRGLLEGVGGRCVELAERSGRPGLSSPGRAAETAAAPSGAAAPDRRATASRTGPSSPCPDTIATDEGFPTNALYGLAAMMMKMLAEERPGRVVVAWDAPGKTFRHEEEPDLQGQPATTPDLFASSRPTSGR